MSKLEFYFKDGDEGDEVTRRKVGKTDWKEPSNISGTGGGLGFCFPEIFWFRW